MNAMEYPVLYRQRDPMGQVLRKAKVEEWMWVGWCRGQNETGQEPSEQVVGQRLQRCAKCNKFVKRQKQEAEAKQEGNCNIQLFANLREALDSQKKDLSSSSQDLSPGHSQN